MVDIKLTEDPFGLNVDQKPDNFHRNSLALMILPPVIIFFAIGAGFNYLFHISSAIVWLVVVLVLVMSGIFMLVPRRSPDAPTFWFNLGVLCLVACLCGVGSGLFNYRSNTSIYWAIDGQREYTNLIPSDPALSHLDAGKILFSADAHVETSKSLKYGSRCVAPIVGEQPTTVIQYWAGGTGCCETGKTFWCHDAMNSEAHGGIVYLPRVYDSPLGSLQNAAKEAAAMYKLTSADDAIFIRWFEDPDKAQHKYLSNGTMYLIGTSLLYFLSSLMVGFCLHFGQRRLTLKNN